MTRTNLLVLLLTIGLVTGPLAGCLSFFKDEEPTVTADLQQKKADDLLGDQGRSLLDDVASATPKNFSFPSQIRLPKVVAYINGSVASESNAALEGNQDQGGIEYNTVVVKEDVSSYIPPGQPVEIFIKLTWQSKEMNGVDYDIYLDLPGAKTSHSPFKSEEMNWNDPSKTRTVNTIGLAGAVHEIGVQAAMGRTAEPVPFSIQLEFNYERDVLTPAVPWAFHVPANASGVILESVKVAGDEHIQSEFLIIGPDDSLAGYVEFNDLAIPTESVFVPTNGPGEYVFWAFYMHGGFLSLRADAPLENLQARPLSLEETRVPVDSAPSPGMVGRDWGYNSIVGSAPTSMENQKEATFSLDGQHPLGVYAWIDGPATLGTQVRISSSKGVVNDLQRIARYDDERGSVGYSADEGYDNQVFFANVVKGAYKFEYVNNGPTEVGYTVFTYKR